MPEKNPFEKLLDDHTNGEDQEGRKRPFFTRIRGYLLAGILFTAPLAITVYLTYVFLIAVDRGVARLLPQEWYDSLYGGTTIPGFGLLIALVFFIIVGWFATNILGRLLLRFSEYLLARMPVVRTLYAAIKQIFETVMASKSRAFREAVMLEYPRKGVWSIGFVTGRSEGEVQGATQSETINVFVPTTPNPTSGYLLFVPKKELIYLEMSIEEAVKLVVSAGIIVPKEKGKLQEKGKTKPKSKAKQRIKGTSKNV